MSASDGVLVRVKDVEKVFHRGSEEIHVLSGLNLEVSRGEFLALMGPSGSGKSSTFYMNILRDWSQWGSALTRRSGGQCQVV